MTGRNRRILRQNKPNTEGRRSSGFGPPPREARVEKHVLQPDVGSAASIELTSTSLHEQGRSVLTRDERATIRIDAATRPADVFFRLTLSREFERVVGPNPEARLTARSSTAGSHLADAIPEGGPRYDTEKCAERVFRDGLSFNGWLAGKPGCRSFLLL